MLVFRYDKTFEGLLTCLFEAYVRKRFPEKLIDEGEPAPMFAEEVAEIVTDKEKAERVWAGMERKLHKSMRNMLMHVWLSEEEGGDELLLRYMRKVFDSPCMPDTDFADPYILLAHQVARRVEKEKSYVIQFARFQKAGDDTYFAAVAPACNALPLAIEYFINRFRDQKWLVYDIRRKYGYYYDLEEVTEISMLEEHSFPGGKLDEKMMAQDEKIFQDMWKSYFRAMSIKERVNPKLHRRNMPRRFWKYLTEKQ